MYVLIEGDQITAGSDDGDAIVPWWSFTKTVLATAVLTLVQQGRTALDEPAEAGRTLRQLLSHTGGLPDYGGLAAYHEAVARREDAWPAEKLFAQFDLENAAPGDWAYSNIGYLLVRQHVERLTGLPLADAVAALVLHPLGIHSARFLHKRCGEIAGLAADYDPNWVYHGLLVGPVGDAALLLHRLATGEHLRGDLKAEMFRPRNLGRSAGGGRPWTETGYGLGLMIGCMWDVPVAGHTGGGPGSAVAVYHRLGKTPPRTVATFAATGDQAECHCASLVGAAQAAFDNHRLQDK